MRYPEFLVDGGCIGFVAPSFGCAREPYLTAFKHAQEKFIEKGYRLELGPNCYEEKGIGISNSPEECGKELTDAYTSSKSNVLISCGGGELMCETMDFTDFEAINKAAPKWFMGYSDNTNFTFLSTTLCDTAAIYGPCVASFGMEPAHPHIKDAFDLLTGKKLSFEGYDKWELESLKDEEHPLQATNDTEVSIIKKYQAGASDASDKDIELKGRLLGGCMDCLDKLVGTKYDKVKEFNQKYAKDGILWFMESCEMNPLDVRRSLWQMKSAGWFHKCSGFIFGRPGDYANELMGLDHYKAVVDILKEYNVPILMDADIGHHPPMLPIISGAKAKLITKGNKYTITYDLS